MINTDFLKGYEALNQRILPDAFKIDVKVKPSFRELIAEKSPYRFLNYIGSGNMNADILIIGKEMAIDLMNENNDEGKKQYNFSVASNILKWHEVCENGCAIIKHANTVEKLNNYDTLYSPVFPYYRQNRKIRTEKNENGGTSRTEFGYQRIIEEIYNGGNKFDFFNLHEYVFLSELSTAVGNKSNQIPNAKRLQSLKERRKLWNTDFFKSFPITILAIGHYIDIKEDGKNILQINTKDVEGSCFDIKFYEPTINVGNKFINVHFTEDTDGLERMLIHTNQMSFYTNDLIKKIGKLCQTFLSQGKEATKLLINHGL